MRILVLLALLAACGGPTEPECVEVPKYDISIQADTLVVLVTVECL